MAPSDTPSSTNQFYFIPVHGSDNAADLAADRSIRQLARSHAVKHALEGQRRAQQERGENFRVVTASRKKPKRQLLTRRPVLQLCLLDSGTLDPFQTLAVDSSRLQTLLGDYKARQAAEPVFSVSEGLAFQHFHAVFRVGLVDPALANSVMLSLVFSSTGGSVDQECLQYRGLAIRSIRERMGSRDEAASQSTIGAILLLAGVEARLGKTSDVQLHMQAVRQLLSICQTDGVLLTDGIKRAIFWQDLHCSILAGSSRIVDHTTFAEMKWTREKLPAQYYRLPLGFEELGSFLTGDLADALLDIYALQYIRDEAHPTFSRDDTTYMAHINNCIASIQSRLMELQSLSPVLDCCRLAAYICSAMLCCTVWCALVIPPHFSAQLLRKLQLTTDDPTWDDRRELLLWLLLIGGSFASRDSTVRIAYIELLQSNNATRFGNEYVSWTSVYQEMQRFIWSDKAFMYPIKLFWDESRVEKGGGLLDVCEEERVNSKSTNK